MEQKSKVYVNPNFKPNAPTQHARMYVNPLFPKPQPNIYQHNNVSTTRIHVNPNFIRPNITFSSVHIQPKVVSNENNPMHSYFMQGSNKQGGASDTSNVLHQNKSRYSFVRQNKVINSNKTNEAPKHIDQKPCTSVSAYIPPKPSATVTKSKYSLVRTNQNQNKVVPKETTMIKINKYKSVAIQNVRKNLDLSTNQTNHTPTLKRHLPKLKISITSTPSPYKNKYKFVNTNIPLKAKVLKSPINRKLSFSLLRKPSMVKYKSSNKQFKLNNIPCPLFRKFGKCIRNERGTCDFLHDKKHVSICRKYLSGSCHDSGCLLSHDTSLKKMPTCSFYLRGMCTKENCPYLHVKLNIKTKVCTEFLKGFCEMGDNCSYRHENVCPNFADKGICFNKQCPYPHKSSTNSKLNKSAKLRAAKPKLSRKSNGNQASNKRKSKDKPSEESNVAENRYYDNIDNAETSEVIKPMRTKLGNLPSFIQL